MVAPRDVVDGDSERGSSRMLVQDRRVSEKKTKNKKKQKTKKKIILIYIIF
jgi:hypothetical protein